MKIYKSYKINIYHNNKIILCDDMSFINDNVLLFELIDYLKSKFSLDLSKANFNDFTLDQNIIDIIIKDDVFLNWRRNKLLFLLKK